MPVLLRSRRGPHGISMGRLRTRAQRMLNAIEKCDAELSIMLVDDTLIQSLNESYRGKDQPTDVLSFAMTEGDYGDLNPGILGDIVISVPTARRQARRSNQDGLDRITFLLAHGLLHLVGYDHGTDEEQREMTKQTRRLVKAAVTNKR